MKKWSPLKKKTEKSYEQYLAEYNQRKESVLTERAAPKGAKGKKTWGAPSHSEDFKNETDFRRTIDLIASKRHTAWGGESDVYICVICAAPVGKVTRNRQRSKLKPGKGYSGLLCYTHMRHSAF